MLSKNLTDGHAQAGFQICLQAFASQPCPGRAPALEANTLRLPPLVAEPDVGSALFIAHYLEAHLRAGTFVFWGIAFLHTLPFDDFAALKSFHHQRTRVGK